MDLEPGTMDSVRSGPFGQIFRPDNFVFGELCGTDSHVSPSGIISNVERLRSIVFLSYVIRLFKFFPLITFQVSLGQATTGLRVTTQRELSWLTLSWMWCGRRRRAVTACKAFS